MRQGDERIDWRYIDEGRFPLDQELAGADSSIIALTERLESAHARGDDFAGGEMSGYRQIYMEVLKDNLNKAIESREELLKIEAMRSLNLGQSADGKVTNVPMLGIPLKQTKP